MDFGVNGKVAIATHGTCDRFRLVAMAILLLGSCATGLASAAPTNHYGSANRFDYPMQVFWGDTHLHTSYSADANLVGNRKLGPETAYRFARGEEVTATNGMQAKLIRPLDFLVISDHAEYLGIMPMLDEADPRLLATETGKRWHSLYQAAKFPDLFVEWSRNMLAGKDAIASKEINKSVWNYLTRLADRFNDPGKFTVLIGYEWSTTRNGDNFHRNVIFRDNAEKVGQIVPFSSLDSDKPEDLWAFLADYEKTIGGKALAIPHNPNISGGQMFRLTDSDGKPFTTQYAVMRARWEPLLEVTQTKGDSETHPFLSPGDLFADYERWDKQNFAGIRHEKWMFPYEYARSALKLGLGEDARIGANPFKFGLIGSTDIHTSLSTAEEDFFWGTTARQEPAIDRFSQTSTPPGKGVVKTDQLATEYAAEGFAAVWARENSRASLFDAMQRRETYATTGPRIMLRFFGGWDFDTLDALRPDYAAVGYGKGVPMGGDLTAAPKGKSPRFLIVAAKDPLGANLERVQVVKGWLDAKGETREKVWDVVLSDRRKPQKDRMASPIRSTVDTKTATYTNTVGDAEMAAVWEDPDFHANQRAFYYLRVLEIPTPRWTTYDAAFYGIELPDKVPAVQQERAYSSPIWYTP